MPVLHCVSALSDSSVSRFLAIDDRVIVELEVGMDVIVECQGALDVHKEQVISCVRVPDERVSRSHTSPSSRRPSEPAACASRLVEGSPGHAGHDGGDSCTGSRCGTSSRTTSSWYRSAPTMSNSWRWLSSRRGMAVVDI